MELYPEKTDENMRLDKYLTRELDETRSQIKKYIDKGDIRIEGQSSSKAGYKLNGDEKIIINLTNDEFELTPQNIDIEIIYEDKDIAIINKEAGIVIHPAKAHPKDTLVNAILFHIKKLSNAGERFRPGIVHRLDKDTSGLVVIAKTNKAYYKLVDRFKNKDIEKKYLTITKGVPKPSGRIDNLIGRNPKDRLKMAVVNQNGKKAISNYRVLDENNGYALIEVQIETGRMHQVRVHMNHIGCLILGDDRYGISKAASRQMLHAYELKFEHPITGEEIKIKGPIPSDFENLMKNYNLKLKDEIESMGE
ncbi:MAG: RluA family pseudouridine synthase [Fusobacteriota bacterium]